MTFCLGKLGLNPGMNLGYFQFRIAVNLFSRSVGLFLTTCNSNVLTLPSSFLSPSIIYHCKNFQLQSNNEPGKRKKLIQKVAGKGSTGELKEASGGEQLYFQRIH